MKNKNKRPNGQKEKRMNNLVTNALLVIATAIGTGLVGAGLASKKEIVTTTQPAITTTTAKATVEVGNKKISQLDLSDKQVLTLYGVVGKESYFLAKQITELGKTGKPIYLLINSPGGSVLDGSLIVSAIEGSPVPVYTICEQMCASMAFIIHQYGHKRLMVDRSLVMGHPAAGGLQGTLEQMRSRLDTIQRYVDKFDAYIANRAGLNLEQFKPMIVSEMWLDAEDATNRKFNDEIVNLRLSVQPTLDLPGLSDRKNNQQRQKIDIKL